MNISVDNIKENDIYSMTNKEMFVHIGKKVKHKIDGLFYILCAYSKYKDISVINSKDIEFDFKTVNEIIALIESDDWIKCVNVKEELKTI